MKYFFLTLVHIALIFSIVGAQNYVNEVDRNISPSYPNLTITINSNPSPEFLFLGPSTSVGHLLIMDNDLTPVFYKKVSGGNVFDFKLQKNGTLSYNIYSVYSYGMTNSGIRNKQYITPPGYALDVHDLQVMEDGSYYIFGRDHITMDMSQFVPGGDTAAIVIAHTIHHMDPDDNELWRWNSIDHYDILDVDDEIDLTQHVIDWTHCNSIDIDNDGNLVISTRNFNEITKIDGNTGAIIWRFGGKRNQFQFVNDLRGFGRQHDARILSTGNLALFDNGHFLIPEYSSYVEYEMDEQNFTATLIRRYSRNGSIYSETRGGVQELTNGNILISWDDLQIPFISEINTGDTTVYEVKYNNYLHQYRAYKFQWETDLFFPEFDSLDFGTVNTGQNSEIDIKLYNSNNDTVFINELFNRDSSFYVNETLPLAIPPQGYTEATIVFEPHTMGSFNDKINFRNVSDSMLIAQQVFVMGMTGPVSVKETYDGVNTFLLYQNFPNPFNPVTNIKYQLSNVEHVCLKVFDVLGNEIIVLVDEEKPAGNYNVELNTEELNLTSGVYIYQLEAGGSIQTKKMMIIK